MSEASNRSQSDKKTSKGRTFLHRLQSSLWAWALVVVSFWINQTWLFIAMFVAMALVALIEFFKLVPDTGYRRFRWQTMFIATVYGVLAFSTSWGWDPKWQYMIDGLSIAALLTLIAIDRIRFGLDGYRMIDEIALTVFGFVYIVILFGFVPKMLQLSFAEHGEARFYVVFLLITTKFTDMGAYLVGSLFGKHKMIPKISPGKTWQGFGGAILFALIGSFGCCYVFGDKIPLITPVHAAILGVLLALLAVLGDLVESILKRSLEAKDSGNVMPGIGGVLDLIDSILLTAPVLFVYLLLLLG